MMRGSIVAAGFVVASYAQTSVASEPRSNAIATAEAPQRTSPPSPPAGRRALATTAAIVPGLLVHGTGHFVMGDAATGRKLLATEAAGLGALAAGGVTLVMTGASRRIVGAAAAMTIGGVALFAVSGLADIYGVVAPKGGFGAPPARLPLVQTEVGYRHVYNPVFDYRSFIVYGANFVIGNARVAPSAWFATDDTNSRLRLLAAYRLWSGQGIEANARDGSYLEWVGAVTHHTYTSDRFAVSTGETALSGRLDMSRWGSSLSGSFAEASLGMALQNYDYRVSGVRSDTSELLLARFGYGIYIGGRAHRGPDGELTVYYDHRHDGFAAGVKLTGLGSGVAGHFGTAGRLFFDEHWGAAAELVAGSAYVAGVSLVFRQGGQR